MESGFAAPVKANEEGMRAVCTHCGSNMRRLGRKGFWQRKIFSLFGYYPWECPVCRNPLLLKKKHQQHQPKDAPLRESNGA
jgi:DNA-directed RNA polymerase subunit RPC12/RpoP